MFNVVSQHIKLNAHGKASCPFHNEKSASFSVSRKKNVWRCFGCTKGGDGVAFLRNLNPQMSFLDAAEQVAEIGGITLEYDRTIDKEAYAAQEQAKGSLREILADGQSYFLNCLWNDARGQKALDYLRNERGYTDEIIRTWGIGYAPYDFRALSNKYAADASLPIATQAGLVKEGEKGFMDFFIDRIIFPIHNAQGEIVSFSGRQLPPIKKEYGKYINGPATVMYDKSRTLYGLYAAGSSITKLGYAILVEGNTDVISMHSAGATNTVAQCGTEFTEAQAKLLNQYTKSVVLIPDTDIKDDGTSPGLESAEKSLRLLLSLGFNVNIYELPSGENGKKQDPDDFAKQFITVEEPEEEDAPF